MVVNESYLWKKIKTLQKKQRLWHFTRIESATIRGIADVNCLMNGFEFWIELKGNVGKNLGLSDYQINWHYKHFKCGGFVFILLPCVKDKVFKLFRLVGLGSCDHIPNHIIPNHIPNHITRDLNQEPIFQLIISNSSLEKLFLKLQNYFRSQL